MLIRLSQNTPEKVLHQPFRKLRNIFYPGMTLGGYDMIAYLNARSPQELNSSIAKFREELGQHVSSFDILIQDKVHHWRQFTAGLFDTLMSEETA